MNIELKETFLSLASQFKKDQLLTNKLWDEISSMYSDKSRHYHTLVHLFNLISNLKKVKHDIHDWETVLFAVFYHDIIYKSIGHSNEEESAEHAKLRLTELAFPKDRINNCASMIIATKGHTKTGDKDTDYFTDADLSILGQSWDVYLEYTKQIRLEYSIYPTLIYNPGRKKVLNSYLKMERIFKTKYFFDKFEKQAIENMTIELNSL